MCCRGGSTARVLMYLQCVVKLIPRVERSKWALSSFSVYSHTYFYISFTFTKIYLFIQLEGIPFHTNEPCCDVRARQTMFQ